MTPIDELLALFGPLVLVDRDAVAPYALDRALFAPAALPCAVVKPNATSQVQELARWAARHRIPIVPRGAGTGVAGGASAVEGGVVLSFEEMKRIRSIDEAAMLAVVEPGVLNIELKDAARECGLWYPPDPASYDISTLGGNVATNAGGLCCVKYGVTRDYVLGLEAVTAQGDVFRTGGICRKDVAGYDLTRLLVGSEGTLALITEITLRLRRQPRPPVTLRASFSSLEAAGDAVVGIIKATDCSLLELMDGAALRAVEALRPMGLDTRAAALLIAQDDTGGSESLHAMRAACAGAGATQIEVAHDPAEGSKLVDARRLAFPAIERLGTVLLDDVAVPLPRLPEMLRRIEARAKKESLIVATVAHAGDGNIHPLIVFDASDPEEAERARHLFDVLMDDARELGGTITGEHGVGSLKRAALTRQLDPVSLAIQSGIKTVFDPLGILNPGKVFGLERTH